MQLQKVNNGMKTEAITIASTPTRINAGLFLKKLCAPAAHGWR